VTEPFQIDFTEGAEADLGSLTPFARMAVMDGAELHLRHEPTVQSHRIKAMRPNPVAEWELRLGDFRVLYDVDESTRHVTI